MRDTILPSHPKILLVTYQKLPVKPHQITCLTPKLPVILVTRAKLLATRSTLLVTFSKFTGHTLQITGHTQKITGHTLAPQTKSEAAATTGTTKKESHMASNSMETPSHRQVTQGPQSPLSGPEQQNARTSPPNSGGPSISANLCDFFVELSGFPLFFSVCIVHDRLFSKWLQFYCVS